MDSRIQGILNFIAGGRVADIGADHGCLSIEAIKSGRADKVIATEKNRGPFEGLSKKVSGVANIEVRLGDGLQVLSAGEVDTICIAGMGGALIVKILNDSPEVVKSSQRLILQPMNAAKKIRDWLDQNEWTIVAEDLAESAGIIYEIICAEKNPPEKNFKRISSPLLKKFLTQRLEKLQRVLEEMSKSSRARTSEKFLAIQSQVEVLRKRINLLSDFTTRRNF